MEQHHTGKCQADLTSEKQHESRGVKLVLVLPAVKETHVLSQTFCVHFGLNSRTVVKRNLLFHFLIFVHLHVPLHAP